MTVYMKNKTNYSISRNQLVDFMTVLHALGTGFAGAMLTGKFKSICVVVKDYALIAFFISRICGLGSEGLPPR